MIGTSCTKDDIYDLGMDIAYIGEERRDADHTTSAYGDRLKRFHE